MTTQTDTNRYYLSVNLMITSHDGSQGRLSTNFSKDIQANSMRDIIRILEAFDTTTDALHEMIKEFAVEDQNT